MILSNGLRALKETGGFAAVETLMSQYESTLIIAQKTISQNTTDTRRKKTIKRGYFLPKMILQSHWHT